MPFAWIVSWYGDSGEVSEHGWRKVDVLDHVVHYLAGDPQARIAGQQRTRSDGSYMKRLSYQPWSPRKKPLSEL
jgi:hypothetical protein